MRRRAALFIMVVWAAAGTSPAAAGERPTVVLVTVDTLRTDRLSCFGYGRPTSPNIDALLGRGVRFERARTVEPLTTPALASMITGVEPHQHGASRNGLKIGKGLESLPKVLMRAGWRTAAFVSNWPLKNSLSRLGEHFEEYVEVFTRRRWFGLVNREATANDVTDEAIDWIGEHLDNQPDRPFLLWVHYVEPHAPYRYQQRFAARLGITGADPSRSDRYDTEVAAVDEQVGRLLEALFKRIPAADIMVFFASDHGESLGEHGEWGHGRDLHEPSLAIPMGLVWSGRIPPRTLAAPATILDTAPTVLELLGMPVPDEFAGFSWAGVIDGVPQPMDRGICYQAHRGAIKGSHDSDRARSKGLLWVAHVRHERKEIVRLEGGRHLLFDLVEDPQELHSVSGPDSSPSTELLHCLARISDDLGALDRVTTDTLDPEDVERLRALGYLE